jgi:hypothetical protein
MGGILDKLGRTVRRDRAGRRFQDKFHAAHESRKDVRWGSRLVRVLRLLVAAGAIVIGLFLTVLPGPAILFFFIAGGLIASESKSVARLLDWSEVKLRAGLSWVEKRWRRLPVFGKVILTCLAAGLGAGLTYASYRGMAG